MRAHRPVFGIAYSMLGSASEASEKPAALQPTKGPDMFSSHVPGFGAARPGLGCTQQPALLLGSRGGHMLGHFRSTSDQGGLLCRAVRQVSRLLTKRSGDHGRKTCRAPLLCDLLNYQ